jgi:hypothetical protein
VGAMCDFLKNFPFMSSEDYMWKYSIPMLRIMSYDATRVIYLTKNQQKEYKAWLMSHRPDKAFENPESFLNDLGLPVFG